MFKNMSNNNFFNKEIVLLYFLYFSLLVGFYFDENSTGGAILDYANQKRASTLFATDFFETFINYDTFATRHSPVLIIFLSFFEKLNFSDSAIRLIYLHMNLLLPVVFYNCLKIKFKNFDKKIFLLLVSLLFFSPTFRSLSIWPDSRILGVLLFAIGIFFFLKFNESQKFKYVILNIVTVSLSAYISPNFAVFAILFFFYFLKSFKLFSKEIIFIILINLFLSFPAFYYIFILDVNFITQSAAINFDENERILFNNLSNDILITYSIILFYIFPFLVLKIIQLKDLYDLKNLVLTILIFTVCSIFFDYNYEYSGGGIFFKISNFIFKNNIFFLVISFLSIYIINLLFFKNKINVLIFFLIILNNPQYTIYHKYFDPFLLICFFTIFTFKIDLKKLNYNYNFFSLIIYFGLFLLINNLKYLWTI